MAASYPWSKGGGGSYPWKSGGGGGRGVGGFLGNLGSDAGDAILGAIPGAVEAVRNPIKTAKAMGASYQDTYGDVWDVSLVDLLADRDNARDKFRKFGSKVYEHPLGPILDVATVASLGSGAALRGAAQPTIALRSPGAIAGQSAKVIEKPVTRKGALVDKALKKLPADTPVVGEYARYARELDRLPHKEAMALRLKARPYQRAYNKLREPEQIALGLIGRGVSPTEYKSLLLAEKAAGRAIEDRMLKLLDRKDVQRAFAAPSPKLVDAVEKARALSEEGTRILTSRGRLSVEAADTRPWHAALLSRGARFVPDPEQLQKRFGLSVDDISRETPDLAPGVWVRAADRSNYGRVVSIDGDSARVHFRNKQEGVEAEVDLPVDLLTPVSTSTLTKSIPKVLYAGEGRSVQDMLAAVKQEFAGQIEPFYLPDKALPEKSFFGRAGGGFGVPRSPVHRSEGVNLLAGMIALQPDLLSAQYLKTVKFALSDDIHTALMQSAVKVPKGDGLPEGFVYIRRPVGKSRSPEKIGYQEKVRGDFRRELDELLPDDDSNLNLTTREVGEAVEQEGFHLAVPATYAREAAGEFLRSSKAVDWFLKKPTSVWRALVLNLRPAWLINNMVGNHLLYAVKFAGPAGLRSYASAVRGKGISREFMDELFPEQVEGTFINTQRPGRRRKSQDRLSLGLAPLDKAVEGTLRRAATQTVLRKSPAVKAKLKEMPKETRSFEKAARLALDEDPLLARRVSDRVNDALGDFLNLTPTERGVIRTAFPFYAWYKAIARITLKLPLDSPVRADLISKLGVIGAEGARETLGDVPGFLLGSIGLGEADDGRQRILNTGPANPWATLPQLGTDISGTVNPFVAGPGRALLGADDFDDVSVRRFIGDSVGAGGRVVENLPQVRLGRASTGRLYQGTPERPTLYRRDPLSELLAYLGVPIKEVSRERAEELKRG